MSRKHNCKHPQRSKSTYSVKNKAAAADRYGQFNSNGIRQSPDRLNVSTDHNSKHAAA